MCFEDIKLGRVSYVRRTSASIGAGVGAQLLNANPDRVAIVFPNLGPSSSIVVDIVNLSSADGAWSLANEGITMSVQQYGQLVTGTFFAFNSGAAPATVNFFEVILQKEG